MGRFNGLVVELRGSINGNAFGCNPKAVVLDVEGRRLPYQPVCGTMGETGISRLTFTQEITGSIPVSPTI